MIWLWRMYQSIGNSFFSFRLFSSFFSVSFFVISKAEPGMNENGNNTLSCHACMIFLILFSLLFTGCVVNTKIHLTYTSYLFG